MSLDIIWYLLLVLREGFLIKKCVVTNDFAVNLLLKMYTRIARSISKDDNLII